MTLNNAIIEELILGDYTKLIAYTDIENSFNINNDEEGNYWFNLNSTIVIDPDGDYRTYELKQDLAWPLVSYAIYGDTKEAWILLKVNEVPFADVFKPVKAGTTIKYLDTTQLLQVANIMSNM